MKTGFVSHRLLTTGTRAGTWTACLLALLSACGPAKTGADGGDAGGPVDASIDAGPPADGGVDGGTDGGGDAGNDAGCCDIDAGDGGGDTDAGPICGGKVCQANATLQQDCSCLCDSGYSPNEDNTACVSCNGVCAPEATCTIDQQNQAQCACPDGYDGDGRAAGSGCLQNHCYRPGVNGGLASYEGDCPPAPDGGDNHASCENIGERGLCVCDQGYVAVNEPDGGSLIACVTNECAPSPCDSRATCTVTAAGHTCECNAPYVGSGEPGTCVPRNRCNETPAYCDTNAQCNYTTTAGTSCECNLDFTGSGRPGDCHLIDYCEVNPNYCDEHATCIFHDLGTAMPGTFCRCNTGYDDHGGRPGQCTLHDYCADSPSRCDALATCHFTPGSGEGFYCECSEPYAGDGKPGHCHPGYSEMSAGWFGACAIRADRQLWCWGDSAQGAVGIGQLDPLGGQGSANNVTCPTQVGLASDWISVGAGQEHVCAIRAAGASTTQGTLWCWGVNGTAQLGYDTFTGQSNPLLYWNSGTPRQVGADSDWTKVVGGWHNTCALKSDGTLWCWGYDHFGVVVNGVASDASWLNGDFNAPSVLIPAKVTAANTADTGWIDVAIGNDHVCGLRDDGSLWCWGKNGAGQVGDGTNTQRDTPVQVSAGMGFHWSTLTAGGDHTLAVRSDGTLWCWGDNANSACGFGVEAGQEPQPTNVPLEVYEWQANPKPWVSVTAAQEDNHVCGMRNDGSVWCWGHNGRGEAAQPLNALASVTIPLQAVGLPTGVTFDSVYVGGGPNGGGFTCVLDSRARIWCFGDNNFGQLGQCSTIQVNTIPTQTQ